MSQVFKLTLGEIVRKVVVPTEGGMKWEAIENAVKERFGIEDTKKIGLSYVDEDGDEITISSTQELNDLVPFPKPAKFNVVLRFPHLRWEIGSWMTTLLLLLPQEKIEEMASTVEGYLDRFGWADFR
ncbi:hypothetical protein BT69DRAFT_779898 [Atractiella rhizophila]|nr:hypothetical protein BT69DRAFT_779898 [Atractiella rhizophila]